MAPCNWSVNTDVCDSWDSYSTATQDVAEQLAAHVLWAATGRRYGVCQVTVRPCQPPTRVRSYRTYPVILDAGHDGGGGGLVPFVGTDGDWHNTPLACSAGCRCRATCEAELAGPVASVTSVTVDGAVVDAGAYRVDVQQGTWLLVRTDGQCWPWCQDFDADVTADNTFQVVYGRGTAVPQTVLDAAGILACEFAKAISGSGNCRLPQRLQSLSRQGVEITAAEITNADLGYVTGIDEVDAVIALENPARRHAPPQVFSPDVPTVGDRVTVVP